MGYLISVVLVLVLLASATNSYAAKRGPIACAASLCNRHVEIKQMDKLILQLTHKGRFIK